MKNITIIAAVGKNLELGKDNNLLWHIKEDLQFFKNITMNKPIIMGIKTFKSIPKMLPGRKHIVLTSNNPALPEEVLIVHSLEELLKTIKLYDEVMVIGGATVYKEMLVYSNKLILTEIDAEKEADTYFPKFDKEAWNKEEIADLEENNIKYKRLVYTKK